MKEIYTARLKQFSRQNNSVLPTPVHKLAFLCSGSGPSVYCKRDDLTGFGLGGNKTRKLDFLVADALSHGCDTLIGTGANQSNFCRLAAAYGTTAGMQVHLVLGGEEPGRPTGNLLLDHLLGASCHDVSSCNWKDWLAEAASLKERFSRQGLKPYLMPVGGSTPIGALGYVDAFLEIIEDQKRLGVTFDVIIHASSSAGTQAGLIVGKELAGWKGRIIGISAAKPAEEMKQDVLSLAAETAETFSCSISKENVIVDDSQLGEGYGVKTPGCAEAVSLFARHGGIYLDYVYTGKAAAGLCAFLHRKYFPGDTTILFIHTGGTVQLFA